MSVFTTIGQDIKALAQALAAKASAAALSDEITRAQAAEQSLASQVGTEYVQDIVGAMVAAAGGSYNDPAGTITLPAGGGGGTSLPSQADKTGQALFTDGTAPTWRPPRGAVTLDIVTRFGAVPDSTGPGTGTDNYPAIAAALTEAKRLINTGLVPHVVIAAPAGSYRIVAPAAATTAIFAWASNISLVGDGMHQTRFIAESAAGATAPCNFITGLSASLANPTTNAHWRGFELDMTGVIEQASYNPTLGKGFYAQYMKRCTWTDLYVHHTRATGIGVDFLVDCIIAGNIVDTCGNFVAAQGAGDSGIGIGSGMYADEYVVVANNIVTGCRNHGIFVEKQGTNAANFSRGFLVIGNTVRGNKIGIADRGGQGMVIVGNIVNHNTVGGIVVGNPEIGSGEGARETLVSDNVVFYNGAGSSAGYGISTRDVRGGRVLVRGNRVGYTTGIGIWGDQAPDTTGRPSLSHMILANAVHNSSSHGISYGPASGTVATFLDLIITGNMTWNNSGAGIRLKQNVTRLRLVGNVSWDDQAVLAVADGATTNGSTTVTAATAIFRQEDEGKAITGTGIPTGTTIVKWTNATTITLSQAATATGTGVALSVGNARTQATGLGIYAGSTVTDGVIEGNDGRGCATAMVINATLAGNLIVRGNPGYTGGGPAAVTVTSSPMTYTAGRTPEVLYIDGGMGVQVVKSGVTLRATTGGSVALAPGESVVISYTTPPAVVADRQ